MHIIAKETKSIKPNGKLIQPLWAPKQGAFWQRAWLKVILSVASKTQKIGTLYCWETNIQKSNFSISLASISPSSTNTKDIPMKWPPLSLMPTTNLSSVSGAKRNLSLYGAMTRIKTTIRIFFSKFKSHKRKIKNNLLKILANKVAPLINIRVRSNSLVTSNKTTIPAETINFQLKIWPSNMYSVSEINT